MKLRHLSWKLIDREAAKDAKSLAYLDYVKQVKQNDS